VIGVPAESVTMMVNAKVPGTTLRGGMPLRSIPRMPENQAFNIQREPCFINRFRAAATTIFRMLTDPSMCYNPARCRSGLNFFARVGVEK
jgi:hypothetical protein